jgi:molecular chaperone Hsp33
MKGDGPIGMMTVTADSHGNIKGFPANPAVDIPRKYAGKLDVGAAVGKGILTVIMDLGLREPYNGQVEIQTGEIGDDLAYYFTVSEQTPSAVGLGVMVDTDSSVKHSGGFIIQLMPDADEETVAAIESKVNGAPSVTSMMEDGMTPEDILEYYLGDLDLKINETEPVRFYCDCSKEKVARALATISRKDLEEIINDGEEIEVKCYFCNSAYKFGIDELNEIMESR